MAYSLEQIFHTDPKVIGSIEIYSNKVDRTVIKDIEKVVKEIAKSLKINLDNLPSGDVLRVYVYPTKRVFYSIFGNEVESQTRKIRNRGQENLLFVAGEGEIHMVSPRSMGNSYTNMISILVKKILEEYEQEEKIKKAQKQVEETLEPDEEELDEKEEEIEDEEVEESEVEDEELDENEIEDEEVVDEIKEIDLKIEEIKEENNVNIPEWLDLGWIMYKKGVLKGIKNRNDYANFIAKNGVTSQGKIAQSKSIVADYNYASESSAAIVEYIVQNYGARKILELFENPDIEKVLGISKAKFSRDCKSKIKQKYIKSKLIEKMKDKIEEESKKEKPENIEEKIKDEN